MTIREVLWQRIATLAFERKSLEKLAAWVSEHRQAIIDSPNRPTDPSPGWIGGSEQAEPNGPRCFIKYWRAGDCTPRHTHPNGMMMVLLEGSLQVDEGWKRIEAVRTVLTPGQWVIRLTEREGFDHFPHALSAPENSVSLHLYSDAPNRGMTIPE